MTKKKFAIIALIGINGLTVFAQQKKSASANTGLPGKENINIPVSKADLGTFPYFKTLNNFYANDSLTLENNRTYFYDGKKYFTIDGMVSSQNLTIKNSNEKTISEFGCIQEFDKVIATLGGTKIYTGKLPEEPLKSLAGSDIVSLGSKSQIAGSAYYGVVEYVIKTPEKEVWVQLVPYTLASKFYTLLVVEKTTPLLTLNTNKENQILADLEKSKKAVVHLSFQPDDTALLTDSKDEILSLVGVFQAHPSWKLNLGCYSAPVGKPEYTLALTNRRADAIKEQLTNLGVKNASVETKGFGDQKPLVSNDTEQGRLTNTRVEIVIQ